ncbi:MAG: hypothetical protein Tp125SUR00d2C35697761_27 [Prokaryotic dsDNA virus sp.]|nr:MAG: hypothetical protein Tp125SUR00d2C35697761_27 [Prokaryotic dsDNA virus sp.]|tara:strand:- start:18640 stop:18993 length:354 start_codon:yes stop_codon:yes gene_type:complete
MSKARFPQRLDIRDMPRDKSRSLGALRQALCASFNYCRKYPTKMAILKEVLKYTYNRINEFEKELAAHEASKSTDSPESTEKAPVADPKQSGDSTEKAPVQVAEQAEPTPAKSKSTK